MLVLLMFLAVVVRENKLGWGMKRGRRQGGRGGGRRHGPTDEALGSRVRAVVRSRGGAEKDLVGGVGVLGVGGGSARRWLWGERGWREVKGGGRWPEAGRARGGGGGG